MTGDRHAMSHAHHVFCRTLYLISNCGRISPMQIGNKFRCYPTAAQEQTLLQWIGCRRNIYNSKVREDQYFRRFARKSLQHAGQYAPIGQQYSQLKLTSRRICPKCPASCCAMARCCGSSLCVGPGNHHYNPKRALAVGDFIKVERNFRTVRTTALASVLFISPQQ